MTPRSNPPPALRLDFGSDEQFRLTRMQTFNWGTFNGLLDLTIPHAGYLFVGPSGSGKSTLLDAHTALLTPPKWVDFNVAAREAERQGRDRSALSYVRGAWAKQTGDAGEYVTQYLRTGTTWSALAETYRDARGRSVVLAQVLWVRGQGSSPGDVKRLYMVLPRELSLRELEFFAASDFDVRRFKQALPEAFVKDEFSAYQERFRGLLGIENERALRLLHKTQSAKNLGDLNLFLRDFMLDPPETFVVAERLVNEFGELNAAHQAVVAARHQIETLRPAQSAHNALDRARNDRSILAELLVGLDAYREQRRAELLDRRSSELRVEAQGVKLEVERLTAAALEAHRVLLELKEKRHGLGGGLLETLSREMQQAEAERPARVQKRERLKEACRSLGWDEPLTAPAFVQHVAAAKERVLQAGQHAAELEERKDQVKAKRREQETEFQHLRDEIAAMERQRSNIPARMLALRAAMAHALGLSEEELPFAGELLQVREDAAGWEGAIERVLHGFAQSLLVDDEFYAAVSGYLNERSIGERIVYFRTLPHAEERRTPGPNSLVRKLDYAPGSYSDWLRTELSLRFDYECTESMQAFRDSPKAVTREGLVRHGYARHEKDDRRRIDDRTRWVLGFDNHDKLQLFKHNAANIAGEIGSLAQQLERLAEESDRQRDQLLMCQTLANLSWAEVDVASLLTHIDSLRERIAAETRARPELSELDIQVLREQDGHRRAEEARMREESKHTYLLDQVARFERTRAALAPEQLSLRLTPTQEIGLKARFEQLGRTLSLDSLSDLHASVQRGISEEQSELAVRVTELRHAIERSFAEFNRHWPADSDGLDAVLESANDYFAKLARLETDGLPRYEERFLKLLREQSDQNLTLLNSRLEQERSAIRARLELVNESLRTAPFNPGTHLLIETQDRLNDDVRQFKQSLKQALSKPGAAASVAATANAASDAELAEQRFESLRVLVDRLSSQETTDRNWRNLVLDVRQHVEFVVRELDEEQREVEVYASGAGKSGGQRQKLAATCLAAALRYQLGGQDRGMPTFSTVALDEAFDKADAEFTTMAMNIFKTFGFQMVVATPLKSVMTLEPFIGGACFVHIRDRKTSAIVPIEYDEQQKRLKLPASTSEPPAP
jgi:uncharacterized protein YPO0396